MAAIEFDTARLRLRNWRESDRAPFAALNADPVVMEFFASRPDREQSDASIDAWTDQIATRGWGLWAAETLEGGDFIGFVGLAVPRWPLPFSPCVEIGWRLARPFWGRGLASEAAGAVLALGFERLELPEIVSFTTLRNQRSRAVMERIGLRLDPAGEFEHPALPEGHVLRRHCLYRLARADWRAA